MPSMPFVSRVKAVSNGFRTVWRGLRWYAKDRSPHLAALLVRQARPRCTFIGVTGTAGKTTTKDLSAAMLSRLGPCHRSIGSRGANEGVDLTVRTTSRLHRFCVVEIGATEPGRLDRSVRAVRPRIAAITLIQREHYSAFRSLEAIADEKAKVVRALGRKGIAVLNIDDPHCRRIGEAHEGSVIWFGRDAGATIRLLDCRSRWPGALTLTIAYQDTEHTVTTRLHGTHLAVPVLAALGIAVASGMPMTQAIEALADVAPSEGRMQIVQSASGVTWLRDDWKAAHWSMQPPLDFMRDAQAQRKIIVIGTISDSPRSPSRRYTRAAQDALKVADIVVLVGSQAAQAECDTRDTSGKALHIFASVRDASQLLNDELTPGDMVLLKGTNLQDHLVRLLLNHEGPIQCWAPNCKRIAMCSDCPRLHVHVEVAANRTLFAPSTPQANDRAADIDRASGHRIVVGLGNWDASLQDTAHNVGFRLVAEMARSAAGRWTEVAEGALCEIPLGNASVVLFKPRATMNRSGGQLREFLARKKRSIRDCIIVYDDFDLPIGTVRTRARGGDGGHKGVQSIIQAFGTAHFHRVRIGARSVSAAGKASDMVLSRFSQDDEPLVSSALEQAMIAIRQLIDADQTVT